MTENHKAILTGSLISKAKILCSTGEKRVPSPSLWWLMYSGWDEPACIKCLMKNWRDYTYYRDKGWFESDYFYPVKLNPFKKLTGKILINLRFKL